MKERDEQAFQRKKAEIMEACFNCYAENGLTGTGIHTLADACGLSQPVYLFRYARRFDCGIHRVLYEQGGGRFHAACAHRDTGYFQIH